MTVLLPVLAYGILVLASLILFITTGNIGGLVVAAVILIAVALHTINEDLNR